MKNKILIALGAILLSVGCFYAGKYSKSQDKSVETTKSQETSTTVIIEKRPDGTIIETKKDEVKTETNKKVDTKVVITPLPEWKVNVGYGRNLSDFSKDVYLLSVSKRVLGNISVGAWGTTDKTVGVLVGAEF